ncbi:unnamed protein product [Parajaminaea phylloscopi]
MDGPSTSGNKTIYVGGLPQNITEEGLVSAFAPFGDIVDVQIPRDKGRSDQPGAAASDGAGGPHRGFGFLVFSTAQEAQDAIDNMHLNVIYDRVLNVNLAKPLKMSSGFGGGGRNRAVWEDEEWIKQYAKPLEGQEDEPQGEAQEGA